MNRPEWQSTNYILETLPALDSEVVKAEVIHLLSEYPPHSIPDQWLRVTLPGKPKSMEAYVVQTFAGQVLIRPAAIDIFPASRSSAYAATHCIYWFVATPDHKVANNVKMFHHSQDNTRPVMAEVGYAQPQTELTDLARLKEPPEQRKANFERRNFLDVIQVINDRAYLYAKKPVKGKKQVRSASLGFLTEKSRNDNRCARWGQIEPFTVVFGENRYLIRPTKAKKNEIRETFYFSIQKLEVA